MILFDTSIWIDHFKAIRNAKSVLLGQLLLDGERVFITPTIIQQVLHGFSNPSYFDIAKIVLTRQQILDYYPVAAALAAAELYAKLRKTGTNIRGTQRLPDCPLPYISRLNFATTIGISISSQPTLY